MEAADNHNVAAEDKVAVHDAGIAVDQPLSDIVPAGGSSKAIFELFYSKSMTRLGAILKNRLRRFKHTSSILSIAQRVYTTYAKGIKKFTLLKVNKC